MRSTSDNLVILSWFGWGEFYMRMFTYCLAGISSLIMMAKVFTLPRSEVFASPRVLWWKGGNLKGLFLEDVFPFRMTLTFVGFNAVTLSWSSFWCVRLSVVFEWQGQSRDQWEDQVPHVSRGGMTWSQMSQLAIQSLMNTNGIEEKGFES